MKSLLPPLVIVNDDVIIVTAHTQTVLLLHIEFYVNGVYGIMCEP